MISGARSLLARVPNLIPGRNAPPPHPNPESTRMAAAAPRTGYVAPQSPAEGQGIAQRVVIVGGVAGGASAAARCRRLSEAAEIVVYEKGPYVSFANCGLPYYIGGVISDEAKLLVASKKLFNNRFNVDVKELHEVVSIDPSKRAVRVRDLAANREFDDHYDKLVLAPGANAIRPPLEGIDLPGIFVVRTIPDSREIKKWVDEHNVKRATVVGGGFIGLEMAENLVHLGLSVDLIEGASQVMPPLDFEMAEPMHAELEAHGVTLHLGHMVAGFAAQAGGGLVTTTQQGASIASDLVILGIGVAPNVSLARAAGLDIGARGIRVNAHMRTSDPHIYAVGDAVESVDVVTGESIMMALAGPANRQGRVAADNINGRPSTFRGVQGTSVVGAFGLTAASTGASAKVLKRAGIPHRHVTVHPANHAGYYPGATPITIKLIYAPDDGRILGAQAIGKEDVARKIDVIATAIQGGLTVYDLEEADLCYAPQYGSAKDAVNMAGFVAANDLRGDSPAVSWEQYDARAAEVALVDVREAAEWDAGHHPDAISLPLSELRERFGELPDKTLYVHCQVGLRGHNATRFLKLHGFEAFNVSGGWKSAVIRQNALSRIVQ